MGSVAPQPIRYAARSVPQNTISCKHLRSRMKSEAFLGILALVALQPASTLVVGITMKTALVRPAAEIVFFCLQDQPDHVLRPPAGVWGQLGPGVRSRTTRCCRTETEARTPPSPGKWQPRSCPFPSLPRSFPAGTRKEENGGCWVQTRDSWARSAQSARGLTPRALHCR